MAIEVFDCEQGSEAWLRLRVGIPTASMFSAVMASGKDGGDSKTRRSYMLRLIGERLTGAPAETYSNRHTERGVEMEEEAAEAYAFESELTLEKVGFIRNGIRGCSPDRLIGANGMCEIKTALPHIQLERVLKGALPTEYTAQVQGQLLVAEREWCDFISYWPRLPMLRVRVYRDEEYLTKLDASIVQFVDEMQELEMKISSMRQKENGNA